MTTESQMLPGITIRPSNLRSANIEYDHAEVSLTDYVLTGRGLDLLRRIVGSFDSDQLHTRAWAITGPYGAGKSSFALLLTALLCEPSDSVAYRSAIALVSDHDPELRDRLEQYRGARGMFLRAVATARKEPIADTVRRALAAAANTDVELAADLAAIDPLEDHELLSVIRRTATRVPLLIVLDEFGKNLELFAESDLGDSDLHLLQELAELAAGTRTTGLTLLTLQHAPFTDYATGTTSLRRREWLKIQGRFLDVTYKDDPADTAAVVRGSITQDLKEAGLRALRRYGTAANDQWQAMGLNAVLPGDTEMFAGTYPLHPVALATLPQLCADLGQHDRTLTGFLASDEDNTLAKFIEASGRASTRARVLGTLRLSTVYDYFATTVSAEAPAHGSRWLEIQTQIEKAQQRGDLDKIDVALLKSIGLLNMIGAGGALRANLPIISFAMADPQGFDQDYRNDIAARCERLCEARFITYRQHDDEYRLWAGTDVDIPARLAELQESFTTSAVAAMLGHVYLPPAVVAGRHSQETGFLRYFQPVILHPTAPPFVPESGTSPDGLIVLHLNDSPPNNEDLARLPETPLIIGTSPNVSQLRVAAAETLALTELASDQDLDATARSEIRHRLSAARSDLAATIATTFAPDSPTVNWSLKLPSESSERPFETFPSMSALTSYAADIAYPQSPRIRSEMLGRHQLTSQGAKARRQVLTALLEHTDEPEAGLTGNGPDMAIYRGVVAHLGLHGTPAGADTARWTAPSEDQPGYAAYAEIGCLLVESAERGISLATLAKHMAAPPFGVKAGVFPILLTSLLGLDDSVAVFEDGTFQTALTPDLVERMVKAPGRIVLKRSPTTSGQAAEVVRQLAAELGVNDRRIRSRMRTPAVTLVAAALLQRVTGLSDYARRTKHLSPAALAVRPALLATRDPSSLILNELPAALGLPVVESGERINVEAAASFAAAVSATTDEIASADSKLLREIKSAVRDALPGQLTTDREARTQLASIAHGIKTAATDPTLQKFLQHSRQDSLSDDDWFQQAAMVLTNKPPTQWTDDVLPTFRSSATHVIAAAKRLAALHLDYADTDARRLTLTTPDGREEHIILQASPAPEVEELLDSILATARDRFGQTADNSILAALALRALNPTNIQESL